HLTPHKNQAAVIRAAARLESKTTVRIIGRGPERASLERLAATLGVACSIESDLTETDMVTAYRTAEVVVCPSTFEGFGLTPMEAIATATPVVASDIPPHREFLGASPHFFTLGDDDGLAAAIAAARSGPPPRPEVLRADEAATLVGRWRARPIVGLATGLRKRDLAGLARSRPDSGWVEGEVARIVAAGDHDECIGTGCASGN